MQRTITYKSESNYTLSLLSLSSIIVDSSSDKVILELGIKHQLNEIQDSDVVSSSLKQRFLFRGYNVSGLFVHEV